MEIKKPPQVVFDNQDDIKIETPPIAPNVTGASEDKPHETESDAAFFPSENAYATRQMETVKPPAPKPPPTVPSAQDNPKGVQGKRTTPPVPPVNAAASKQSARSDRSKSAPSSAPASIEEKKKKAIRERKKRKREQIRTFSHIIGSVLLVAFILTTSAFLSRFIVRAFLDFTGIKATEYQVTVQIPPDVTTEEIAKILFSYELIDMPELFTFYSRVSEKDGKYLSGLFNLNSTMSYSQIVENLQNRPQSTEIVSVKIIEGMTALTVAQLLEENNVCRAEDFLPFYKNNMNLYNFEIRLAYNPLKFNQMEGYLFPDTYEFFVVNGLEDNPDMDTTMYAKVAAQTIFSHFNAQITAEMYRRIGDINETLDIEFGLDEFMTLASMVQLEASEPEDMRKVASVFFNRLKNPETFPKLESDVSRENYGRDNILPYREGDNDVVLNNMIKAYNSYESDAVQNGRLVSPPGPVCNPGLTAMLAVLDYADTDYFYFCANIDTGEIFYAESLAEHEENEILAGIR